MVVLCLLFFSFVFLCYGDHRDLLVLTHSFPTRRSSDLRLRQALLAISDVLGLRGRAFLLRAWRRLLSGRAELRGGVAPPHHGSDSAWEGSVRRIDVGIPVRGEGEVERCPQEPRRRSSSDEVARTADRKSTRLNSSH